VAVVARVNSGMFLECQLQQVVMGLRLAVAGPPVALLLQKEVQAVVLLGLDIHLLAVGVAVLVYRVITPVNLALLAVVVAAITKLELLLVVLGQRVIMVVPEIASELTVKTPAVLAAVAAVQAQLVVMLVVVMLVVEAQEHLTLLLELLVPVVAVGGDQLVKVLADRAAAAVLLLMVQLIPVEVAEVPILVVLVLCLFVTQILAANAVLVARLQTWAVITFIPSQVLALLR
jgi:hypothetical protein